ncbi:hypothetical protein KP003_16745 [Geomonas nitrogeniifigens]|uniref:hypothetical protein n=1 Tax=Geomonas diazotrophica TaxID=2843197 RepID=UPI001C2C96C0|nr:hypothetical protein [Geomonas nitrogeniifigens]QXE85990.1 hypothetical protein KP003_16745 [Geomonas nitrogeniifigens]
MSKEFELPEYDVACSMNEAGEGTPLTMFIEHEEPAGDQELLWRDRLAEVVQSAFTAGRALGRREMKEEAIGHINALASAWASLPIPITACSRLIAAIEAIPEEQ